MSSNLAALVTRLFPGEVAKHASWKRAAVSTKDLATVRPPPVPVRGAASVPLEDGDALALDDADIIDDS